MKLFKDKQIESINEKIEKAENRAAELESEILELEQAYDTTVEEYAIEEVGEDVLKQAEELLRTKRQEHAETVALVGRLQAIKKRKAVEAIPFVKQAREKQAATIQKRYDDQVQNVQDARNRFLAELAKIGAIAKEVKDLNFEYNETVRDVLGESGDEFGSAINERTVISGGWTNAVDCLGVDEQTQKQTYSSGTVPHGFGGDSE